jgi:hypothetical protein
MEDILVRAKRIENAINAQGLAYAALGTAMLETAAAVSAFFKALAAHAPTQPAGEPPAPPEWKM